MTGAIGNRSSIKLAQVGYPTQGQAALTLVPSNDRILLHSYSAFNAGGAACDVGLGIAFGAYAWKLYQYPNGTGIDVTAAIQAGTATNIFDTTTNHGFMVECSHPFGYLAFNLTQAQSGSPVYVYEYWNGTAWTTLNLNNTPVYTGTGYAYVIFNPPVDWVQGDNGLGVNTGYAMRARASTAGGQAVTATSLRVARWIAYNNATPVESRFEAIFDTHAYILDSGEAIAPYFSTANNENAVEISFQVAP